jgi:CRISPR type III-B/RAMP module-associated protein Cmr5
MKPYKSAADRLPAMILTDGLLQALAFYKAKEHLKDVYNAVEAWFQQLNGQGQTWRLLEERLLTCSVAEYRADTSEALAFVSWLKRLTEARYKELKRLEDAKKAKHAAAGDTEQAFPGGDQPDSPHDTEECHE